MGKRRSIYDLEGINPTAEITKHLNKKGKIKANNKKEKKALESICTHNRMNKKGEPVPLLSNAHGSECTCQACKDKVPLKFFTHEERVRDMQRFRTHLTQGKYLAVALGADRKVVQDLCETTLRVDQSIKPLDNLTNIGRKTDKVGRKKKKKKKNYSSYYGSWDIK